MEFRKEIIKREDKGPIIKLFGELDIYASQDFKDSVMRIYRETDDNIYLDFENLEYIDSTGLGALISILKEVREADKKVYIRSVNERIRKLFKITKLEEMFVFVGDLDE